MTVFHPVLHPEAFCSKELTTNLHYQLMCLAVVNIILALIAVVGNTLILIALHKESSLRQPSKILLCSLASSDLCLGFSTLVFATCWLSTVLRQKWQSCQYVYLAYGITAVTLFGVSLFTTTAVSVDRLLALLLGLRYRLIVTVKRVYATVVVIWVFPILGIAVEFYTQDERRIFASSCIMLSLILAMCCYLKIYLKLRRRQIQVRETNMSTPVSLARYRKTVHNALWVQLAFLCHCTICVSSCFRRKISSIFSCIGVRINFITLQLISQPIFVLLEDQASKASSEKHIESIFLFSKWVIKNRLIVEII